MSEAKYLMCFGDIHYRNENPALRIDDYRAEIRDCLYEGLSFAADNEFDAVLFLGDNYDQPDPGGNVRNELIDILNRQPNGEEWPFARYSLVGNHDIIGHQLKTLKRTAIGTLGRSGVIIPGLGAGYSIEHTAEVPALSLYCAHFTHGVEFMDHTQSQSRIYALHANILREPFFDDKYILCDDFQVGPHTQLVITGHYHSGYATYKREDGVVFANPGSIARIDSSSSIDREVGVLLVKIEDDKIGWKFHKLESAKPGRKIFDLKTAEQNTVKRKKKDELHEKLKEIRLNKAVESGGASPIDKFSIFAHQQNVSSDALSLVIESYDEISINRKRSN